MGILLSSNDVKKQLRDRLPWQVFQTHDGTPVLYLCPSCFATVPNATFSANQKTAIELHIDWHGLMHHAINSAQSEAEKPWDPRLTPGWRGMGER